ncbi:hypothetical protein [Streptomyces sp. NRRL S-813]|uniref:hypothetical protein n=1 Tax=Streptomyces sp. NRRL S-813 TaxID=1463919 RepID=UPI0004C03987|nr:hypothetical protein [Streptomyces sp. NRRL S-813]
MPRRRWLPHPPATVNRPRPCPTRLPRYATRWLALAALPIGAGDARITPAACPRCGEWHHQQGA